MSLGVFPDKLHATINVIGFTDINFVINEYRKEHYAREIIDSYPDLNFQVCSALDAFMNGKPVQITHAIMDFLKLLQREPLTCIPNFREIRETLESVCNQKGDA